MTNLIPDNFTQSQAIQLWESTYQQAAIAEGWDLFCNEDALQIQRHDESGKLESDSSAWELVAQGKELHHIAASEIIKRFSEKEWQLIALHLAKQKGAA